MRKRHRSLPYHHRIAMVFLIFTLIPCMLLWIIYYNNVLPSWKKSVLNDYYNASDTDALLLSRKITELQSKQFYVLNNYSIRYSIATLNHHTLVQNLDMITDIEEVVASITADNPELRVRWYPYQCTKVYGSNCYPFSQFQEEFSEDSGEQAGLFETILSLSEGEQLWMVREISREKDKHAPTRQYLCLYTQMTNLSGSDCILEFSIPLSQILAGNELQSLPGCQYILHLKQGKEPLYLTWNSAFSSVDTGGLKIEYSELLPEDYIASNGLFEAYEIISAPLPNVGDSEMIYLVPDSFISAQIRPNANAFLAISLLVILLIISASYLTSYLLTRKISDTMNTISKDLDHILLTSEETELHADDLGQLSERVKTLIRTTQEYCARSEHYEAQNLRMELELLQMRFNPHLLYNTLGAIRYQASPAVRHTIDSLCRYYRIILNNGYQIIPIKDEIDMIKEYFEIEKFAYQMDNVSFEMEIEEQVLQYTIIKHVLQPIAENALHHGLSDSDRDGLLKIQAFSDDNNICFQISDNGIGMTADEVAMLLEAPKQSSTAGGYGIYNVQQRIQLYYGKEYGLQIESSPGQGTCVFLRIPKTGELPARS